MPKCSPLWALALGALAGCGGGPQARTPLCGPTGTLRVGVMDPAEGRRSPQGAGLSDGEIEALRNLLEQASRCTVELEPLASAERARTKLASRQWDAAFLPPGLTAFALGQNLGYSPLRSLGSRQSSRAALLVRSDSRFRRVADLNGARVGLLPRGSLGGFYLPLYNMHGLRLGPVSYGLDYASLLARLQSGELDAIAWDESLPDPGPGIRRLQADSRAIPLGALVMGAPLTGADYLPFLRVLDGSAAQMPASIGYAAAVLPEQQTLQPLKAIVAAVEGWSLPQEGQPHRVYGRKVIP
ncbi:MAG: PhnD/SsuA/transferrin family substrate-binding protein [Synechococcus sp.]|nr:PhnD/SsuA/transferrin family substrate-binding protein [Synechococcus sp.]